MERRAPPTPDLDPEPVPIEPALLQPLLGIDERSARRDADLLGRVIDTFVAAQLRPELSVAGGSFGDRLAATPIAAIWSA